MNENTAAAQTEEYRLPAQLLQAIVSTLNELPARQVRALLNAIEGECLRQDAARAEQAWAEQIAVARGQLAADGWSAPDTPRPAPDGSGA